MPEGASVFGGWPFVRAAVYDALPPKVQPLFRHCASPFHHNPRHPSHAAMREQRLALCRRGGS